MIGEILALLSLLAVAASLGGWIHGMRAVRLEGRRGLLIGGFALGLVLSVGAFVQGTGMLAGIGALFALLTSGVFLGLAAISGQERKQPAVSSGGSIIDFTAPGEDEELFDSSTLRGRPFLLKFFRGHW